MVDCPHDCNGNGSCNPIGLCKCNKGYYGYDCSVAVNDNCATNVF